MIVYFGVTLVAVILSGLARVRGKTVTSRSAAPSVAVKSYESRFTPQPWNFLDLAVVALLVSFAALRYEVGTDFQIYALNFAQIQPEYWQYYLARSPLEVGYTVLSIVVRALSANPFAIFWVSSALTVLPAYAAIKKLSRDPTLSVFLFITLAFYVAPFNAIRQGIAVSLVFWASTFIGRKTWLFIGIAVVASTFHLTALFAAAILVVARKWRPTAAQVILALIIAAGLAAVLQIGPVQSIVDSIVPRYGQYAEASAAGLGAYLVLVAKLLLLFLALRLTAAPPRNEAPTEDARHSGYVAIGLAFLVIGTQYLVVSRMEMYFGIFLAVLIPNAIAQQDVSEESRRLKRVAVIIAATIFFALYLRNYGELLPYQTSLSHDL